MPREIFCSLARFLTVTSRFFGVSHYFICFRRHFYRFSWGSVRQIFTDFGEIVRSRVIAKGVQSDFIGQTNFLRLIQSDFFSHRRDLKSFEIFLNWAIIFQCPGRFLEYDFPRFPLDVCKISILLNVNFTPPSPEIFIEPM